MERSNFNNSNIQGVFLSMPEEDRRRVVCPHKFGSNSNKTLGVLAQTQSWCGDPAAGALYPVYCDLRWTEEQISRDRRTNTMTKKKVPQRFTFFLFWKPLEDDPNGCFLFPDDRYKEISSQLFADCPLYSSFSSEYKTFSDFIRKSING